MYKIYKEISTRKKLIPSYFLLRIFTHMLYIKFEAADDKR